MAYRTAGDGHVVVLLHGNPTSSYLWRHVVPRLAPMGRVIAPDLMGMGGSEPVADSGPGSYRLIDHRAHLDGLPDLLVPDEPLVLVGHDWGGVLAFDWARRHALRVRGIAYTETIVRPRQWAD
jgi:haloalkane dehalogenase